MQLENCAGRAIARGDFNRSEQRKQSGDFQVEEFMDDRALTE